MDTIYRSNNSTSKKNLTNLVSESFHGKAGRASQKDLFLKGAGSYAKLFERDGTANATGSGSEYALVVPTRFTRRAYIICRIGRTLTVDVLAMSTLKASREITGSTLFRMANEVLKNCKIALVFAKEFLDKNGDLPSGQEYEAYLDYVLEKMYNERFLKSNESKAELIEESDDEKSHAEVADAMPRDWMFRGYWAFCLFGPYPKGNCSTLLERDDLIDILKDKRQAGRQEARTKQKIERLASRSEPSTQSPFKRGMTLKDRIQATALAHNVDVDAQRSLELDIMGLRKDIEILNTTLQTAVDCAKDTKDYSRVHQLEAEIDALRREINALREARKKGSIQSAMVQEFFVFIQSSSSATSATASSVPTSVRPDPQRFSVCSVLTDSVSVEDNGRYDDPNDCEGSH